MSISGVNDQILRSFSNLLKKKKENKKKEKRGGGEGGEERGGGGGGSRSSQDPVSANKTPKARATRGSSKKS